VSDVVYLGLGSNIGAREVNVLRAARVLGESVGHLRSLSPLYETAPVAVGEMRSFINAVAAIESLHAPADLLKRLHTIEGRFGRSGGHDEPRTLDLDVIAMGDAVVRDGALTIPHPRYWQRRFVLVPLRDIAPSFSCPLTGRTVAELLQDVDPAQKVRRISSRSTLA
jgi:2-amino-4-hydroxy-6-hydroxymethyldihydropteridine diphosphokinase